MNHFCIQTDEENRCIGFSVLQEVPNGYIDVGESLFPDGMSYIGRKFNDGAWEPEEEPASQLDTIEGQNLAIMEAIATQYEEQLAQNLTSMEVQATIYETLLEMQEGGV
ncbi:MAG: hypothetical protein ACI4PM_00670 [Butyricicoccus sp.]